MRRFALVVLAFALAAHVWGVAVASVGQPHVDEVENLHAAWLLANGERLYETFFEHHSPFVFAVLEPLAPRETGTDALPFFQRARLLSGLAALAALIAFAVVLWRVSPEAAAIATLLIVASSRLWFRAFVEVRGEPFALALFWIGTALAVSARPRLAGAGIGLLAASALWNPKFPISIAVVCLFWLVRHWRSRSSIAVAVATSGLAIGSLALLVPLDVWWFFNADVNAALGRAARDSSTAAEFAEDAWRHVPDAFRPTVAIAAALLGAAAAAVDRKRERLLILALLAAAALELRFVLPYPILWVHYFVMWAMAAAALIGMVPSSIATLLARSRATAGVSTLASNLTAAALAIVALVHTAAVLPRPPRVRAPYWVSQQYLASRLERDSVVWLEPDRHPITVRDAHYYWFLVSQMAPAARELARTERGARYLRPVADLPPCASSPKLRFTMAPEHLDALPDAQRCTRALLENGRGRRTVFPDVVELRNE